MANSPSALKRARQNLKRRDRNRGFRSRMRSAVKALRAAIERGDREAAQALLPGTVSVVDATAQKGVIHRNTASRTASRLTRAVAAIEG